MAQIILTDQSPGAPTLTGQNGSLAAILDWALPQKSWAIAYSSGNSRVYRPSAGNRHYLFVAHDSAISGNAGRALVRGCEGATGATTADLVDAFPRVDQVADSLCNWALCAAGTTPRPYLIVLDETYVEFHRWVDGTVGATPYASNSDWDFFGDLPGIEAGDIFGTVSTWSGGSGAFSVNNSKWYQQNIGGFRAGVIRMAWCRDRQGLTKSTYGMPTGGGIRYGSSNGDNWGAWGGAQPARGGYANRINRERVGVTCLGVTSGNIANSAAVYNRGWLPNIWNPVHNGMGSVNVGDDFKEVAYNPSATFLACRGAGVNTHWGIVEITSTWNPPGS